MEIRPVNNNDQSNLSATEIMRRKVLRRPERVEAIKSLSRDESQPPKQSNIEPGLKIKRERLVLSISRPDGSALIAIYA